MSYNKRTWANGNVVGAVDLNRMEQGIEDLENGGKIPFFVTETREATSEELNAWSAAGYTLPEMVTYEIDVYNLTWQELYDAIATGQIPFTYNEIEDGIQYTLYVGGTITTFGSGYRGTLIGPALGPALRLCAVSANDYLFRLIDYNSSAPIAT